MRFLVITSLIRSLGLESAKDPVEVLQSARTSAIHFIFVTALGSVLHLSRTLGDERLAQDAIAMLMHVTACRSSLKTRRGSRV